MFLVLHDPSAMIAEKTLRGSLCADANDQRVDCDQSGVVAMAPLLWKCHGQLGGVGPA